MTTDQRLGNIGLSRKFSILLTVLILFAWSIFFIYSRYSLGVSEKEFDQKAQLLAKTMGAQSQYSLLMGDSSGLSDELKNIIGTGDAVAGAFYDKDGKSAASINLDQVTWSRPSLSVMNNSVQSASTVTGKPVVVASMKILNQANYQTLGFVSVVISSQSLESEKDNSLIVSFSTLLFFGLFGWIAMALLTRAIIRPVKTLKESAQKVAAGDFSVRVALNQGDEVGQLAAAFNIMVEKNKKSMDEVNLKTQQTEEARQLAERMQREAEEQQSYLRSQFERISEVIEAVTKGDLTRELAVEEKERIGGISASSEEVAALIRKINQMIRDLSGLIGEVHTAGDSLAEASGQISSAAEEMSTGAADQATQTREVATAIEQMSKTVIESSRNASDAANMSKKAAELANVGERVFQETIGGMTRIAQLVKKSADIVDTLGKSSAQIGEIIQVIDDIADQTNLLALNAAIEAARAGEQGRGFAVVADEVRKLAERTTSATKEIAGMIKRIQQETTQVVNAMTEGNTEAENGMRLADKAADSLSEIISSVNGVVGIINQIAVASGEQSSASEQISHNVESISTVASHSMNATGKLALTAESLNTLTKHLRDSIARFHLNSRSEQRGSMGVRENGKIVPLSAGNKKNDHKSGLNGDSNESWRR